MRLKAAGESFVAPDDLGDDPAQAARDLDALIGFGYQIGRDDLGRFTYEGPAPRLCPDQIEHDLGTRWIGRRIAVWNRVSSTNDLASQASGSTSNEGLVVLAEDQTRGRGRRGRAWIAPTRSSILMSVLLFPPPGLVSAGDPAAGLAWLTTLAAVATAETTAAWTPCEPSIKWPNDVRVAGRKIAGVLVERGVAGAVVLGVGLNVNIAHDQLPPDLREVATSIQIEHGRPVDRSEVARRLIRRLDYWYDASLAQGPLPLTSAWRSRCEHMGRQVEIATPLETLTGVLVNLDPETGLILCSTPGLEPENSSERGEGVLTTIPFAQVLSIRERRGD